MTNHFHAEGSRPSMGIRRSLDAHPTTDVMTSEVTGVSFLAARETGEAVRVDISKVDADTLMFWLCRNQGYRAVSNDAWTSRSANLLDHFEGVNHNSACCPACDVALTTHSKAYLRGLLEVDDGENAPNARAVDELMTLANG